ncbi:ATP-binding cassette (ABC) Superfamily [Phytophthora palmivora]|uniref:ATP-binding cassette (ABC) Superfamily n=1 Tax=Phytophthora palmivora TaxID=4796 RepID=A0A2P4YB90_9STRA|nr:ATP-binding cassette (ABC) Superfamily [Phytophthora palmivora]
MRLRSVQPLVACSIWFSYPRARYRERVSYPFDAEFENAEEEGAVTESQEISNNLDERGNVLCAFHASVSSGYYPPYEETGSPMFLKKLSAPRGLNQGHTSRGAYECALVQNEPLFVDDIESARCVLLAQHRSPEDRGGLFPVWGYSRAQPENTTTQSQAEDLFWRWVSLTNFTVQELKELREDRLLSYVLDQHDLSIEFAHLIAKRQLHSVMEGHRQQSKSAHDGRGYGTTYAPAVVDPRSRQPSGSQPGAGLPAPSSSATRVHKQLALPRVPPLSDDPLHMEVELAEELSHAFECEAPSPPYPSGPSTSGRDSVGSLLSDDVPELRDHVYTIEIDLGLGPGGQAAAQASKPGTLEVLRQDVDALGRETRKLHECVDRRFPASALKKRRRGLDARSHDGRMPSYKPQGYSYHSAYGYCSYASSFYSVWSYPSYDSRGYQPVYHSQASTLSALVIQRTQPRFEEVSSHLGLPPSEKEDPADRDTT